MTIFRAQRLALASLLLMAMLWGSTFAVAKDAISFLPPADLLALRYTIALGVLVAFMWRQLRMSFTTFKQGLVMGVLFSIGQMSQTFGLATTNASISGFLTGTYVIFTPLLASLIWRNFLPLKLWWAVGFAAIGLGVFSTVPAAGTPSTALGTVLTLIGAIAFAGHILATGHYATVSNAMSLTLVQTLVIVMASWAMALPDGLVVPTTTSGWLILSYLAIVVGAATLFLQNWAQTYIEPTTAAVVMVSEPIWAAVFAVLLGMESISWQMIVGGLSIIAAMFLVAAKNPLLWISHKLRTYDRTDCATPPNRIANRNSANQLSTCQSDTNISISQQA